MITIGKREEQDRGGGREQGPSVCGVGKPEQSWAVYGERGDSRDVALKHSRV